MLIGVAKMAPMIDGQTAYNILGKDIKRAPISRSIGIPKSKYYIQ